MQLNLVFEQLFIGLVPIISSKKSLAEAIRFRSVARYFLFVSRGQKNTPPPIDALPNNLHQTKSKTLTDLHLKNALTVIYQ